MNIIKINKRILLYTLITLFLTVACKKETEYEPLTGQLIGYVAINDTESTGIPDFSDVEIVVEGSEPQIKTSPDESGKYIIDNLQSGVYNLTYNKEGFCQYKIIGYQFVGGNKPVSISQIRLYRKPDFEISELELTNSDYFYTVLLDVKAKVSKSNENSSSYPIFRYYLSKEPDVSYNNYHSTNTVVGYPNTEYLWFDLEIDTLEFPVSSELYMIMYASSESSSNYIDINTGNKIYTTIDTDKPSNIASITIPKVKTPW